MIKLKSILLEKTLYHGTIIDNVPSIKAIGLIPMSGNFVSNAYDEVDADELPDLVFATDKKRLSKAVSAATAQVGFKLGKGFHDVTDEDFINNAAILKIEDGDLNFDYSSNNRDFDREEHPYTVEPGDYYSRHSIRPDDILTGKSMIKLLSRYGLWPRNYGETILPKTNKLKRDRLIKYYLKHNTKGLSKYDIIKLIMDIPEEKIDDYYKHIQLKSKYNLNEGIHLNRINNKIQQLEDEWDRLDSQGIHYNRQRIIRKQLEKLYKEKKRWDDLYSAVKNAPDYKSLTESNKQLVMESTTSQQLEYFLRDTIKGTEWEGKVFAVGGYVRDEIRGEAPDDLDVVVDMPQGGVKFTEWLAKKLGIYKPGSNPVIFPHFGTANMKLKGIVYNGVDLSDEKLDAVMPRAEQYHDTSTRKPTDVEYTDLKGDASRRDLTINAIYKDISTGKYVDPVGGISDIKNKIIRTPSDPDLIYKDDALRMFRVIRFATRYGWNLTSDVAESIRKNINRLHNTSKERIRDELNKILKGPNPDFGIKLLRDVGLLPYISKELQLSVGMTQNKHHQHDVFDHTMDVLRKTDPVLIQRLMALFHDIGKVVTRSETPTGVHFYGHEDAGVDIVDNVMRNLKYPTELIQAVKVGVKNHMRLKHGGDEAVHLTDKSLRKFKFDVGDQLDNVLGLIHADNISHADASSMPNQIENVKKRLTALNVTVKKPQLPINGQDLIQLGLKPGPIFTQILSKITDAWFENPNITREDALKIVNQITNV